MSEGTMLDDTTVMYLLILMDPTRGSLFCYLELSLPFRICISHHLISSTWSDLMVLAWESSGRPSTQDTRYVATPTLTVTPPAGPSHKRCSTSFFVNIRLNFLSLHTRL